MSEFKGAENTGGNHSLSADIVMGWKPRLKVIGPIPLNFDNEYLDRSIKDLLRSQASIYSVIYLVQYGHLKAFFHKFYADFEPKMKQPFLGMNPSFAHHKLIFDSCFESGNLDCVVKVREDQYDCVLRIDSNTMGHIMWYYFRVSNYSTQEAEVTTTPATSQRNNNNNEQEQNKYKKHQATTMTAEEQACTTTRKIKFNIVNLRKNKSCYQRGMKPYMRKRKVFFDQNSYNQSKQNIDNDDEIRESQQSSITNTNANYRYSNLNIQQNLAQSATSIRGSKNKTTTRNSTTNMPKYFSEWSQWYQGGQNISVYEERIRFSRETLVFNNGVIGFEQKRKTYRCLTFQVQFEANQQFEFAYCVPYTYGDLMADIKALKQTVSERPPSKDKIHLEVDLSNESLSGLQVPIIKVTEHSSNEEAAQGQCYDKSTEKDKYCVFIMGRQHPGESNGSHVMKGILNEIIEDSPQALYLRQHCVFKIIPMLNVDGVVMGNFRTSLYGKDLNRLFKNEQLFLVPQIDMCKDEFNKCLKIHKNKIVLFLDVHGHSARRNSFCYGPGILDANAFSDVREYAKMIAQQTEIFRYPSCTFRINQDKKTTARACFSKNVGIGYTIESSNWSYYSRQKQQMFDFSIEKWEEVGGCLVKAATGLIEIKVMQRLERKRKKQLKDEKKQKIMAGRTKQPFKKNANTSSSSAMNRKSAEVYEKAKPTKKKIIINHEQKTTPTNANINTINTTTSTKKDLLNQTTTADKKDTKCKTISSDNQKSIKVSESDQDNDDDDDYEMKQDTLQEELIQEDEKSRKKKSQQKSSLPFKNTYNNSFQKRKKTYDISEINQEQNQSDQMSDAQMDSDSDGQDMQKDKFAKFMQGAKKMMIQFQKQYYGQDYEVKGSTSIKLKKMAVKSNSLAKMASPKFKKNIEALACMRKKECSSDHKNLSGKSCSSKMIEIPAKKMLQTRKAIEGSITPGKAAIINSIKINQEDRQAQIAKCAIAQKIYNPPFAGGASDTGGAWSKTQNNMFIKLPINSNIENLKALNNTTIFNKNNDHEAPNNNMNNKMSRNQIVTNFVSGSSPKRRKPAGVPFISPLQQLPSPYQKQSLTSFSPRKTKQSDFRPTAAVYGNKKLLPKPKPSALNGIYTSGKDNLQDNNQKISEWNQREQMQQYDQQAIMMNMDADTSLQMEEYDERNGQIGGEGGGRGYEYYFYNNSDDDEQHQQQQIESHNTSKHQQQNNIFMSNDDDLQQNNQPQQQHPNQTNKRKQLIDHINNSLNNQSRKWNSQQQQQQKQQQCQKNQVKLSSNNNHQQQKIQNKFVNLLPYTQTQKQQQHINYFLLNDADDVVNKKEQITNKNDINDLNDLNDLNQQIKINNQRNQQNNMKIQQIQKYFQNQGGKFEKYNNNNNKCVNKNSIIAIATKEKNFQINSCMSLKNIKDKSFNKINNNNQPDLLTPNKTKTTLQQQQQQQHNISQKNKKQTKIKSFSQQQLNESQQQQSQHPHPIFIKQLSHHHRNQKLNKDDYSPAPSTLVPSAPLSKVIITTPQTTSLKILESINRINDPRNRAFKSSSVTLNRHSKRNQIKASSSTSVSKNTDYNKYSGGSSVGGYNNLNKLNNNKDSSSFQKFEINIAQRSTKDFILIPNIKKLKEQKPQQSIQNTNIMKHKRQPPPLQNDGKQKVLEMLSNTGIKIKSKAEAQVGGATGQQQPTTKQQIITSKSRTTNNKTSSIKKSSLSNKLKTLQPEISSSSNFIENSNSTNKLSNNTKIQGQKLYCKNGGVSGSSNQMILTGKANKKPTIEGMLKFGSLPKIYNKLNTQKKQQKNKQIIIDERDVDAGDVNGNDVDVDVCLQQPHIIITTPTPTKIPLPIALPHSFSQNYKKNIQTTTNQNNNNDNQHQNLSSTSTFYQNNNNNNHQQQHQQQQYIKNSQSQQFRQQFSPSKLKKKNSTQQRQFIHKQFVIQPKSQSQNGPLGIKHKHRIDHNKKLLQTIQKQTFGQQHLLKGKGQPHNSTSKQRRLSQKQSETLRKKMNFDFSQFKNQRSISMSMAMQSIESKIQEMQRQRILQEGNVGGGQIFQIIKQRKQQTRTRNDKNKSVNKR